MNTIQIILIVMASIAAIFGGTYLLIPWLIKRGINVSGILDVAKKALSAVDTVIEALAKIKPEEESFKVIDKAIDYAQRFVDAAEKLYKTSQIQGEDRKKYATEHVYEALRASGVEVTDSLKTLVDGLIEGAVWMLPKTHDADGNISKA